MKIIPPAYLGDGVYAQVDSQDPTRLIITSGSHELDNSDNVIYLEPEVMRELGRYISEAITE